MERIYIVSIILIILLIISRLLTREKYCENCEKFEKVKIVLKQKAQTNFDSNSNNEPNIIIPIYAPWRTYWTFNNNQNNEFTQLYYSYYPYYYNNYYV